MSRRRLMIAPGRAVAVVLAVGALTLIAAAPSALAGAQPVGPTPKPIGPDQYFGAMINGSTGHASPVTVRMACFGPLTPNETGHPVANQSIAVLQAPPGPQWGYTGPTGSSVTAWFGAPPPTPGSGIVSTSRVSFDAYGRIELPTSLELPCAGTGNVIFLTASLGGDRSFTVPVDYVSIGV